MNTRTLALLALLPLAAQAGSPLIKLNDNGSSNIMFTGEASVAYNDNIFFTKQKTSDTIFTIAPGLELNVGGDGNSKFKVTAKEAFSAYNSHDNLNSQLGSLDALYTYDAQSKFKGRIGAGIAQSAQPTNQTAVAGAIVHTTLLNGLAIGEYKATEKSTIETGAKYNGTRYTTFENAFNDQDSISIPLSWFYAVTDKLDAGFTYQYTFTDLTKTSLAGAADPGHQSVNFIGLTARGQATEKLKLEANAGIGFLDISGRKSIPGAESSKETTFNFGLTSTYAITEKLTGTASASRNFSAGAVAQGVTSTQGNLGLTYAISEKWSAATYTGLAHQKFDTGGHDDIFTVGGNIGYAINKYWKTSLSYGYMNDKSSRGAGFNDNLVTLSASVKY